MKLYLFFSMVFKLTDEQEQFFKTVLMYISNERKSTLIQVLNGDRAAAVSDIIKEI